MPIPGGIGVTEGGLTFGLISAGMPEERVRRRDALPPGLVLPAAGVGLLRHGVAPAQPAPVTVRTSGSSARAAASVSYRARSAALDG